MIAWAGMEMYEAGWRSSLRCGVKRKWPLDGRGTWAEETDEEVAVEDEGMVDTKKRANDGLREGIEAKL